jgi:hypothetical protein
MLPASGRGGLGKARAGPDAEAAVRRAARAGRQERARRRVPARHVAVQAILTTFYSQNLN